MSDNRTTEEAIAAVLAAAERLALPVTVEYSRRPPPLFGVTGEVEATIRDDDDEPLAARLPMDVDATSVATVTDPQAEAIVTILNDAPLLAAELRDLLAARTTGAGALARVLASPEGEAIVDPADRDRLLELVADAGGGDTGAGLLAAVRDARAQLAAAGVTVDAAAILAEDREPLTVGAALALPQVQDGTHAIEAIIGVIPEQWVRRADDDGEPIVMTRMWRPRAERWRPWSMMSPDGRQFAHRCRLVPIAEADADPSTRGPL